MTQDEFEREHQMRREAHDSIVRQKELANQSLSGGVFGQPVYLNSRQGGKTAQQLADEALAQYQAGRAFGVCSPINIEGLDLIAARAKTHGSFDHHSHFTDAVKLAMRGTPNWHPTLNAAQREALDCIAMKLGRILAGDPNHPDHIDDLIGYATLFKQWSGK